VVCPYLDVQPVDGELEGADAGRSIVDENRETVIQSELSVRTESNHAWIGSEQVLTFAVVLRMLVSDERSRVWQRMLAVGTSFLMVSSTVVTETREFC
jgi:hypothetical protein